jgi:apolipoprotein N-acyltransferase
MIRARFLSGFPWSLLGASQFQLTPLLQISAFTGVYGVSFLVVWLSVSLLCATILLLQVNARRNTLVAEVFLPMLVIAIIFAAGYHHVTNVPPGERSIRVAAIQPSIPQTTIWNPSANQQRFADLMALSEQAVSNRTELLLWPEAALPELNETTYTVITNFAAQRQLWFLLGADDVQLRPGATREDDLLYFNAAWLLSPRGLIADTYHKRRLVMFGEYIPLADTLPFLKWFTTITGSFTPGKAATQLQLRDLDLIASPLICFEDVFPHGVREHVSESTDLLVNLTNDGWFGEGSAQWQHVANAVFRAIENRRPLVRACNNGVTCWIDAEGRVREVLLDGRDQPYGTGFVTFQIPIANRPHAQTFYNQHGDVFGWGCFILSGFAVAARAFRRKVAA